MGKTNFSKVEKSLEDGLIKITSRQLLADTPGETIKPESLPSQDLMTARLQSIARDLQKLHKMDSSIYKKLNFSRDKIKKLLADPTLMTIEDWQKIKTLRSEIAKQKQELAATQPFIFDEDIVEKERLIQKNRRFNVNDKWLPLK